jgi:phospholipase D1/2
VVARSKQLSWSDKLRLVAPIVVYAALAFVAWKRGFLQEQTVTSAARSSGVVWLAAVYVVVYAAVGALALPTGPLSYASGAVFGFWKGSIVVWIASMIAAVGGYYLARGVMAKPARRLLGPHNEKLRDLRKGNVVLTTLRLQLFPLVPFGVFNYAAAISKLDPIRFVVGTAIGIIPGTLLSTFIGDRFVAGARGESKTPYLLAGAALLVVLALTFAPKLWDKFRTRRRKD